MRKAAKGMRDTAIPESRIGSRRGLCEGQEATFADIKSGAGRVPAIDCAAPLAPLATSRQSMPMNESPARSRIEAIKLALGQRSIVLVGMMGAGKSAVGKRLGNAMGLPFKDADVEIEAAATMSIPDIFALHGEAFFRDKERRIIARLLTDGRPIVLATGGGAYMNEETRETIRQRAVSIWLRAEFDVLFRRVKRKANRPLLQNPDPEGTLRTLIMIRDPIYAEADVSVESRDVAHEVVLTETLDAIARHLGVLA